MREIASDEIFYVHGGNPTVALGGLLGAIAGVAATGGFISDEIWILAAGMVLGALGGIAIAYSLESCLIACVSALAQTKGYTSLPL